MSDINIDQQNKKRGLGRGLGSLLGGENIQNNMQSGSTQSVTTQSKSMNTQPTIQQKEITNTVAPENRIWKVDIEKLIAGSTQPRRQFEKESIEELARSIKEKDIIQPILVRRNAHGKMEIIAGERRWRAAQIAGLHQVPVIIKDVGNKEALEIAIIENVQRKDLNPIEEAEGYERLCKEFSLSQQDVATKVGKERVTITNSMRLLNLPTEVKDLISNNQLTTGHAKVLLSLNNEEKCKEFALLCLKDKLSVRKLEKLVQKANSATAAQELESKSENLLNQNMTEKLIKGLAEEVQKALGTKVTIDYSNSKGKINIYFYSDEELSNIVEKLRD